MPYTPPTTSPALSPSKSMPSFYNKKREDLDKPTVNDFINESNLQQLKDILSTSPQLSTSPSRRKSAPESLKKSLLKVDLPLPLPLSEIMPSLIRKKSGEIVKSSLKKGISKSAPVTPTFPKFVHFNADLEQIKLFKEAQRPQAVSAEVSSDESDDDDDDDDYFGISEFEDDDEEENSDEPELIVSLPNRPIITTLHSSKPVFVESIFLSQDKRKLQGRIMVQNIAFQKTVNIRYTFDFWSTVSEVTANYESGVQSDNKNNFDIFVFSIELIDNSRNPIDGKTMYFAVHYIVEGRDFWDNNNGSNYQVNFKMVTPLSTPTSKKHSNNSNVISQNKWRPTKNLDESICRSPPTLDSSPKFNLDSRKKVFGNYDIGVSLSAAQNTPQRNISRTFYGPQVSYVNYGSENFNSFFPNNYIDGMPGTPMTTSSPITIPSKPAIGSSSYYDLVNQYCFYSGSPPIMT